MTSQTKKLYFDPWWLLSKREFDIIDSTFGINYNIPQQHFATFCYIASRNTNAKGFDYGFDIKQGSRIFVNPRRPKSKKIK